MGVQGFPTLKIVKPGKKPGRPVVEDYQGPRSAKAIVDAVVDKIGNHVKKVSDANLEEWLEDRTGSEAKVLLFTEKGTTSALLRSLAIDFLGSVGVGQVRSKETKAVEKFGVKKFPTVVLIAGEGQEAKTYDGEMKKKPLVDFISQVSAPNPDPAPSSSSAKPKPTKAKDGKKSASASSAFSKASKAHESADLEDELAASTIILDDSTPTESPLPIVEEMKPIVIAEASPISVLATPAELSEATLGAKKGTSVLVLAPAAVDGALPGSAAAALASFAQVADKHNKRKDHTFPFYHIPAENEQAKSIRSDLGLSASDLEIIVINGKRGWWRHFSGDPASFIDIESFVDNIKLGEGSKQKLPADFGGKIGEPEPAAESVAEPVPAATPEPEAVEEPQVDEEEPDVPEPEPIPAHNEL